MPKTVIYDPELTISLPKSLSVTSGINAIAHAAEGLYAQDANPIMSLCAEEGIRPLAQGLPNVVANPADIDARADCLYGAWLCGAVLGSVGMALHHKLCHTVTEIASMLGAIIGKPCFENLLIKTPNGKSLKDLHQLRRLSTSKRTFSVSSPNRR